MSNLPVDPHAPPATPPAGDPPAPPSNDPPSGEPPSDGDAGSRRILGSDAIGRARAEERKKTRQRLTAENDRKAKALGFDSHEALLASVAASRNGGGSRPRENAPAARGNTSPQSRHQPSTPREEAPRGGGNNREQARLSRKLDESLEARRRANRARAQEEKRRRRLERENDALRAEMDLKVVATQKGVKDVDYALHLLRLKLSKMKPAEIESFDEEAWFAKELRKTHPYLYQAVERPAETTPEPVNTAPSPTSPNAPAPVKKDVRDMSRVEYDNLLRQRGLTPPGLGMPS